MIEGRESLEYLESKEYQHAHLSFALEFSVKKDATWVVKEPHISSVSYR